MTNNNSAIAEFTMNDISGAGAELAGNYHIDTDNNNNTEAHYIDVFHTDSQHMDMKMSEYGIGENTGMEYEVREDVDLTSESHSSHSEENTGMKYEVSEDVNMTSDSHPQEHSAEDTTIEIFSTGAKPIENPHIPADTDDGDDIAKLDFSTQYTDPNGVGTKTYTGTSGANTFQAEGLLNAKPEIIAKHVGDDGRINWQGVAGENDNRHDHWVEGPGEIEIYNFGEGDKFIFRGHTAEAILLEESDGVAKVGLISDQGRDNSRGNGAHDLDVLGKVTIYHDGSFNFGEDVTDIADGVFDGVTEFA